MKRLLLALVAAGLMIAPAFNAEAARKTRDLVFEEEDSTPVAEKSDIKDAQVVSVKTTLELTRDGKTTNVLPTHKFKSGDKVKLVYTTNIDGYVYWMAKGSSGTYAILFPSARAGMDNAVKKNTEYNIPVKGAFRFDDTPGKEELLCILSAERVPELEKAVAEAASAEGVESSSSRVNAVKEKNTSKRKTRDLVFEEEDGEDVNTKTQVAPKGEPFVAFYELVHN